MNLAQRYEQFLLAKGFTMIETRSKKYKVFQYKDGKYYYFVGKKGAVRGNSTSSVSSSVSVTSIIHARMVLWENKRG